jgi:hypothetical protein
VIQTSPGLIRSDTGCWNLDKSKKNKTFQKFSFFQHLRLPVPEAQLMTAGATGTQYRRFSFEGGKFSGLT